MASLNTLAERASSLKAELDAVTQVQTILTQLRKVFSEFPALRETFAIELSLLAENPDCDDAEDADVASQTIPGSNLDRIKQYLKSLNGRSATAKQITDATSVPSPSFRLIVYKRFTDQFDQISSPGKATLWKLRSIGPSQQETLINHDNERDPKNEGNDFI